MEPIILASASPRRSELLKQAGIPFAVRAGSVDEDLRKLNGDAADKAQQLAYMKASQVSKEIGKGIVLGADTIVVLDGEIFGKPADRADAFNMLSRLSGKEHFVITGLSLIDSQSGRVCMAYEQTKVKFAKLSEAEICSYISTGEPFGKAGAYAVQGVGALLVEGISGCYSNVVGLPLIRLRRMLEEFGIRILG
jgi:septum formation protein